MRMYRGPSQALAEKAGTFIFIANRYPSLPILATIVVLPCPTANKVVKIDVHGPYQ